MAFNYETEEELDQYLAEVAGQAQIYMNHQLKTLNEAIELTPDLVSGNVYKDKSQLPGQRLKSNILANPARLVKKFKMTARFIIGYDIPHMKLFWEIWYLPFYGKYILVDKFGKKSKHSSGESTTIKVVIKHLFDIVSTHDIDDDDEDEMERFANRAARKAEYDWARDEGRNRFEGFDPEEVKQWRTTLLEANVASRKMLGKMVNVQVKNYDETKMNKNKINRLWGVVLGRDIVYPSRFQGGRFNKILRIFGRDKEATFVTGFSFENRIDIEIWFVKSTLSGKGSFYVFNLTSAKLVRKNLQRLRDAYREVSEIMSFDVGEISDMDTSAADTLNMIRKRTKPMPTNMDDEE